MNRRGALTVIGGSIATVSLSGCLDDSETSETNGVDDESGEDTESDTESQTEAEENTGSDDENSDEDDSAETEDDSVDETKALIESAEATLGDAADEFSSALDETDDLTGESSNAIETRPIQALIDEARADLSTAREGATDEQLETIDALEDVADFLSEFVDVFADLGNAMDEFELWSQYIENERWDDAANAAERADAHNQSAIENATVARSSFESIDTTALDDFDEIDRVEIEVSLDEIDAHLDVFDALLTGSEWMARGMKPSMAGANELDQEQYATAAIEFRTASDRFDRAYYTFVEAEKDAPADLQSDVIEMTCEMKSLRDMAHYYALGSEAMADGDRAVADENFQKAQNAAEQCESTAASVSIS